MNQNKKIKLIDDIDNFKIFMIKKIYNSKKSKVSFNDLSDLFKLYHNFLRSDPVKDFIDNKKIKEQNNKIKIVFFGNLETNPHKIAIVKTDKARLKLKQLQGKCNYKISTLGFDIIDEYSYNAHLKAFSKYKIDEYWFFNTGNVKKYVMSNI